MKNNWRVVGMGSEDRVKEAGMMLSTYKYIKSRRARQHWSQREAVGTDFRVWKACFQISFRHLLADWLHHLTFPCLFPHWWKGKVPRCPGTLWRVKGDARGYHSGLTSVYQFVFGALEETLSTSREDHGQKKRWAAASSGHSTCTVQQED